MVYRKTIHAEQINYCPAGESDNMHYIQIEKWDGFFKVGFCCEPEREYVFRLKDHSDYERVKFNIMEAVFECDNSEELMDYLEDIFEDGFADILIS